ncbi:MAG: GNAT family N-acetyltransferase [Acidimicrobiia bacterium]
MHTCHGDTSEHRSAALGEGRVCLCPSAVIDTRVATEEDWPGLCDAFSRTFGMTMTAQDRQDRRSIVDLARFRIAYDSREIVGIVGSYAFEVTLPGGNSLPMAGITWVSTAATHRRQGIVSRLIAETHQAIVDRGEPIANLMASAGGIYERFGYGVATRQRVARVSTDHAQLRDEFRPQHGAVRFMGDDEACDEIPRMWDRYRRTRAGEVSRSAELHAMFLTTRSHADGGASSTWYLRHADGYASYRIAARWTNGWPEHELTVLELVALTTDAHAALWHTLLGVDLVKEVSVARMPEDDPLPYLLTDYRAVRTTAVNDGVWVNALDPTRCFAGRAYQTEDRFVVETHDASGATSRFAIEGGPDGGSCSRVRTRPDMTMTSAALSALLYGGVRPSLLAAGRRITARDDATLRRADLFFVWPVAPLCQTPY